jgi:hypothetical protein
VVVAPEIVEGREEAVNRKVTNPDPDRLCHNVPFGPISASDENFNPQNTQCIPVVEIFIVLELKPN